MKSSTADSPKVRTVNGRQTFIPSFADSIFRSLVVKIRLRSIIGYKGEIMRYGWPFARLRYCPSARQPKQV